MIWGKGGAAEDLGSGLHLYSAHTLGGHRLSPSQDGSICLLLLTCSVYLLFNSVGLQILSHLPANPSIVIKCKLSCL